MTELEPKMIISLPANLKAIATAKTYNTDAAAKAAIDKALPEIKRLEKMIDVAAKTMAKYQEIVEAANESIEHRRLDEHKSTVKQIKRHINKNSITFIVDRAGMGRKYPDFKTAVQNLSNGDKLYEVTDGVTKLLCVVEAVPGKLPKQYAPKWTKLGSKYKPLMET